MWLCFLLLSSVLKDEVWSFTSLNKNFLLSRHRQRDNGNSIINHQRKLNYNLKSTPGDVDSIAIAKTAIQKTFSGSMDSIGTILEKGIILKDGNMKGNEKLQSMKQPYGKDEAWRFTNLRRLFAYDYDKPRGNLAKNVNNLSPENMLKIKQYLDSNCDKSCLVFIDGQYCSELSSTSELEGVKLIAGKSSWKDDALVAEKEKATIISMLEYVPDVGELPRDTFGSDAITALNLANLDDMAYLCIPAGVQLSAPVHVMFCSTAVETTQTPITSTVPPFASASFPRLLVDVQDGASVQLKQSFVTLSVPVDSDNAVVTDATSSENNVLVGPSLVTGSTRVLVGANASCTHTYVQELADSARHLEALSAEVKSNASYDLTVVQAGSKIGRVNAHLTLVEESSNCSLNGITLAGERQSLDIHSSIVHDSPSATSEQTQRNVIADMGEAIFKGRIRIPTHAQLTESGQLCRTIMLGRRARILAMPTLEIRADNVVCSHGASVTDLDENSMFYLAARGIDRSEGRKLLLKGFVFDLLPPGKVIMDDEANSRIVSKLESMYPKPSSKEEDKATMNSAQKFMSV